jgi:hypothetical protein
VTGTENVLGALGVTIVRGRGFGPTDWSASTNAVVISERAALSVFGSADILGRQISIKRVTADGVSKPETSVVIGVAGDTDVGRLFERDTGVVYAPLRLDSSRTRLSFVARGQDDAQVTAQRLQTAMRRNAPSLISTDAAPARTVLAGLFVLLRYTALLAGIFGVATLALSAIGLYGLLSQIVAARTREVGVRLALGATPFHVLTLVLRDGLRTVLVGLAIGVGIGAAVRTLIRFTLNQAVAIVDFSSVAAIGILLLLAGALACYLPGRRAARLEPSVALREL